MRLKIGCCGFPVGKQKYYEKFGAVEVQETFYQPPKPETARKWRLSAPDGFEFTLKAWQPIAHGSFKPTDKVFKAWEETDKIASELRSRVIVFQCPPSFTPTRENKDNFRKFFKTVKRKKYRFVWEPRGNWGEREIKRLCEELDIIHCVDPFESKTMHGDIRYFRLHGIEGYRYRYKGWDLKQLQDFCEKESQFVKRKPIYVFFNNMYMMEDAGRFKWIVKNTGRIKSLNLDFLKSLCCQIDAEKEEEKVQILSREAERIVSLILHTDYAKVDIDIEKEKLRKMCVDLFPDKARLFEMIYERRFERLWRQFRENLD
jgi:uncharacterized protein YecE (DUF72 family)